MSFGSPIRTRPSGYAGQALGSWRRISALGGDGRAQAQAASSASLGMGIARTPAGGVGRGRRGSRTPAVSPPGGRPPGRCARRRVRRAVSTRSTPVSAPTAGTNGLRTTANTVRVRAATARSRGSRRRSRVRGGRPQLDLTPTGCVRPPSTASPHVSRDAVGRACSSALPKVSMRRHEPTSESAAHPAAVLLLCRDRGAGRHGRRGDHDGGRAGSDPVAVVGPAAPRPARDRGLSCPASGRQSGCGATGNHSCAGSLTGCQPGASPTARGAAGPATGRRRIAGSAAAPRDRAAAASRPRSVALLKKAAALGRAEARSEMTAGRARSEMTG